LLQLSWKEELGEADPLT